MRATFFCSIFFGKAWKGVERRAISEIGKDVEQTIQGNLIPSCVFGSNRKTLRKKTQVDGSIFPFTKRVGLFGCPFLIPSCGKIEVYMSLFYKEPQAS